MDSRPFLDPPQDFDDLDRESWFDLLACVGEARSEILAEDRARLETVVRLYRALAPLTFLPWARSLAEKIAAEEILSPVLDALDRVCRRVEQGQLAGRNSVEEIARTLGIDHLL